VLSFIDVWNERMHTLLRVLVWIEMEGGGGEMSSRGKKLAVVKGESGKVEALGPFAGFSTQG